MQCIPLSALPKDTTSELAGFVHTTGTLLVLNDKQGKEPGSINYEADALTATGHVSVNSGATKICCWLLRVPAIFMATLMIPSLRHVLRRFTTINLVWWFSNL